jgi:2C-methyl-D-erythritol 2,4-cyclodiphosphate synthase
MAKEVKKESEKSAWDFMVVKALKNVALLKKGDIGRMFRSDAEQFQKSGSVEILASNVKEKVATQEVEVKESNIY